MLVVYVLLAVGLAKGASATSLAWDPDPENLAIGYVVHYGTSSGQYSSQIDVSYANSYPLPNLSPGFTYYFVVTAYNVAHVEGPASNEVQINIPALGPPVASFTASTTSVNAPVAMNFVNTSTGAITSYAWNFGDGTTDSTANPTHVYLSPGIYSVTLTVTGPSGTSTQMSRVTTTSLSNQSSRRATSQTVSP